MQTLSNEIEASEERSILPTQVSVSLSEAYERGKVDINFFAGLCMPEVCVFPLPSFYIAIWQILVNRSPEDLRKLLRFALGLPRGHAKTTFIKILICWMIVYDKVNFALIICANSDLAELLLADIHDILSSPNLTSVYGNWAESLAIDSADTKKAAYHNRSVTLIARGWSAGVRGINIQNQRPDLIFCDDCQTRKNDESPTERDNLLKELVGTIFKAIAPFGARYIIYVGNMYSDECILNKFRKSRSWISMITGAILENGTPLWPELFTLEDLMESYYHDEELGLAHVWFAEIMNDPKNIALSLLPHPIPDSDQEGDIIQPDGAFITIDPAGFRKTSDDNVIAVHYKFDNKGYVVQTVRGIMDPSQLILEAFRLAALHNCSLIGIEDVGYQQTLGFWVQHFLKEFNIKDINVVPLRPHGRSKETRIRLFIAELYKRTYFLHSPETRRDYTWQASLYKIGKKDNKDDLLDAIAYGVDVRNEYWHLIRPLNAQSLVNHLVCSVQSNNTPF
jgi:hypothetical protein